MPSRPSPGLVPEHLLDERIDCPTCRSRVEVPWTEKLAFPKQPIESLRGDGYWVPASFPLDCANCGASFQVTIEKKPIESRWTLYGDEAGRFIHKNVCGQDVDLHFFCITLVALHGRMHNRFQRSIRKLKRSIAPKLDPSDWQHHFTDIWSAKPTSQTFVLRNKEQKVAYAKEFARLIRKARPELSTFNVSGCIKVPTAKKERARHIKRQKEEIFSQSILATLEQLRSFGKGVAWVFDNIKDASNGERSEGWAEECFLGLQYTRLFAYLSAGAAVLKPKFVSPGSHFLLETADFFSYCVAREFEMAARGKQAEFPTAMLGEGFYQATLANGDLNYKWSTSLPLKEYYGIEI